MIKKTFFFTAIFFFSLSLFAQVTKNRFKETKNIYVLDLTLSMWGKSQGAKDIFNEVREELIKVINTTNNENTEIVIVTFQDAILDVWEEKATKNGKQAIIDKLNNITENNVPKQNTNIHGAWKKGRSLIDPAKLNVVFLLTDGEHSVAHTSKATLYKEVADWGNFANNKDYYAFLVELTEQASDPELRKAVQATHNAQIIKGIEFFIISIEDKSPVINIHDDLNFNLKIIGDRSTKIPEDFTLSLELDDPNFKIKNGTNLKLQDNPYEVKIESKRSIEALKKELPQVSSLEITIKYDVEKYPQVKLLDNTIICTVKNKKEMVLYIEVLEEKSDR